MNPNIPEEIQAMAALIGQSSAIDSLMLERPVGLETNTNTIKRGLDQYVQQQRGQQLPRPTHSYPHEMDTGGLAVPIPNYVPPIDIPPVPQYGNSMFPNTPPPQKVDDGQLELNLEPSKVDIIINLLKEISTKLTKQNNMLEKQYANQSKKEGIPTPVVKLRTNS